jgi:hypothetical protein
MATGYGQDGRGSILGKGKIFSPQRPHRLWDPSSHLSNGYGGNFSRGEANHSPPSSAEVKNGGAISPLPLMSSWHCA